MHRIRFEFSLYAGDDGTHQERNWVRWRGCPSRADQITIRLKAIFQKPSSDAW